MGRMKKTKQEQSVLKMKEQEKGGLSKLEPTEDSGQS